MLKKKIHFVVDDGSEPAVPSKDTDVRDSVWLLRNQPQIRL